CRPVLGTNRLLPFVEALRFTQLLIADRLGSEGVGRRSRRRSGQSECSILRQQVTCRPEKSVADQTSLLAEARRVGVANQMRVGPQGENLVLKVGPERRRRIVRQAIDSFWARLDRGAGAGRFFLGRGLVDAAQGLEVLAGFVGPAGRGVAVQ